MTLIYLGPSLFNLPHEHDDPYFVTEEWLAANTDSDLPIGSPTNRCVMSTIIFQSFVFMQLFNQMNSRDLKNEFNVLKGV